MKASEVKVGGHYVAMVSNSLVVVRLDSINETGGGYARTRRATRYACTNLKTGREVTIKSAQKFRREVKVGETGNGAKGVRGTVANPLGRKSMDTPSVPFVGGATVTPPQDGITAETERSDPTATSASAPATTAEQVYEVEETMPNGFAPPKPLSAILSKNMPAPNTIAGYTPTDEQAQVLDAARTSPKVLVIAAGAGAGKTSTLKMLEQVMPGRGQYTAFNASLVAESKSKFRKCAVNTTHSIAFRAVGSRYAHRLGGARVKTDYVAQVLGIDSMTIEGYSMEDGKPVTRTLTARFLAGQVLAAIRKFCQSADREITQRHFKYIDGIDMPQDGRRGRANNEMVSDYLLPFAAKAWSDLSSVDGTLPFSHDHYVKIWQLGTGKDRPVIAADYILLDEAQDTAPVFLDVLKQQTHATLVFVGDSNQQIYEWRGAKDAMKEFPGATRRLLTQSFRFGQIIADVANSVLAGLDEPTDLVMRGLPTIPSRVAKISAPRCILCRTNAGAVSTVLRYVADEKRPHLIGGGSEVVAFVKGARDLQEGRSTSHPDLCCFASWGEVEEYAKTDEGEDLKLLVKLIKEFGCDAILRALEGMPAEKDADVVVSTAHKSKGREWDTVKLASDFPPASRMGDSDRRLLYVALTRAKLVLDISECSPFRTYVDPMSGEETAGIKITYTIPMPEATEIVSDDDQAKEDRPAVVSEAPAPRPVVVPADFTWSSYEGKWYVRGKSDMENQTVTVVKKSGQRQEIRIKVAVQKFGPVWLYEV